LKKKRVSKQPKIKTINSSINSAVASNTKEKDKLLSGDEKSFIVIKQEEPKVNNIMSINKTKNSNVNKLSFVNNLTEDSIYNKRNVLTEKYLANKPSQIEENMKTENITKYITDQEDKISNFENNVNLNFSPNRYSRISMSSFRESCDFEVDKKFICSISNNDDLFSSEENKKPSLSKKLVNPKLLLSSLKCKKNSLINNGNLNKNKNSISKQKTYKNANSISQEKETNLNFNKNIKSLSNSFINSQGNSSLLKSQISERIETQSKNNINCSKVTKHISMRSNDSIKNKITKDVINKHSRSISMQMEQMQNSMPNALNKSCGIFNTKNPLKLGFQRIVSKSTRGKNYFLRTENEEVAIEKKKKLYKDYELEIVPINNIILNYKDNFEDSVIEKFNKDFILPANVNTRLKRIFNNKVGKKPKITSKIERRSCHSVGSFYNCSNFAFYDSLGLSSNICKFSQRNYNSLNNTNVANKILKTLSPSDINSSCNNSFSPPQSLRKINNYYNLNEDLKFFNFNQFANKNLNDLQSKNSFRKAIEKFNRFNEIRSKFEKVNNSSEAKESNIKVFSSEKYNEYNNCDSKNQKQDSKNLKEIKRSLEKLNCGIKPNFAKSIRSLANSNHLRTEADNLTFSPNKRFMNNLTIDHNYDFHSHKNTNNLNVSPSKNRFLSSQNNFNFIYDMNNFINNNNNYKNNLNAFNTLNSFSFQQSPKNNGICQSNQTIIKSINKTNASPYKISHSNVFSYLPDPISNNIELVDPFQNNIIMKLINKHNSFNKSQFVGNKNENETLLVQNTVNESIGNSIHNNKKNKNNSNCNNITSVVNRSKSLGRTGKFMPEIIQNFSFNTGENHRKITNYNPNPNDISTIKRKIREYSHDDILIEDDNKYEKQNKELRENIKKIKSKLKLVQSPNTLNDPTLDLIYLKKMKKNETTPLGNNVNVKIKRLIEENKILLSDNLNSADSDILNYKNEISRSRIKSKHSNSNFNFNQQNYLNTITNIYSNHANKLSHIRDKSKDLFHIDNITETRKKSKNKYFEKKTNFVKKKMPYILSEGNIASSACNYDTNLNKGSNIKSSSKATLEDKINVYISHKIEEHIELKSARYTYEKKIEDLNEKFNKKFNNQIKSKKTTTDENYNNIRENLKNSDKTSFLKEFVLSKNKELEQDIHFSDNRLCEFKDKFFKNFGKETERDSINSFYRRLNMNGSNNTNTNKDSILANMPVADFLSKDISKLNHKYCLFEKKPNIDEKIVTKNLQKLKCLLNLEEKDSREMKFYNNLNPTKNYNNSSPKNNIYYSNKNNLHNYTYDLRINPISGYNNEEKIKVNIGHSLKVAFHNNSCGNYFPKNDLYLDDIRIKKICQKKTYKFNI